ncbi:thiol:disulfide interchange protein tlpA [Paenibacillus sp. J31TS4]|uniref:redoxin domain-containing protein n=1 Tax=Paenibacillus sp. J31TS4 TaxID=2807195 RepID=UPI001B1D6118|nr:redoxin domain-containing protein [Paenibacillus sp. J31TS4]GIP40823.1 thiol:disulfide interchange protein tlpA [Paenibacillus sp. J31TS4]
MKLRNVFIAVLLLGLVAWGVYDTAQKKKAPLSQPPQAAAPQGEGASEAAPGVAVGNTAVDFMLTSLDGKPVKLSDYRGKRVMLNFWATWCPPCQAEMPHMEKFYKKYADEGVVMLAVNLTHTEKAAGDVPKFVEEYGLSFPIVLDEKGEVSSRYQVVAYPTSFILDSQGVIQRKFQGAINYDTMKETFAKVK